MPAIESGRASSLPHLLFSLHGYKEVVGGALPHDHVHRAPGQGRPVLRLGLSLEQLSLECAAEAMKRSNVCAGPSQLLQSKHHAICDGLYLQLASHRSCYAAY